MADRKSTPRRNQPVKRLLDEVVPKRSVQSKGKAAAVAAATAAAAAVAVKRLVHKGTQSAIKSSSYLRIFGNGGVRRSKARSRNVICSSYD
jgi:hypothetical protein